MGNYRGICIGAIDSVCSEHDTRDFLFLAQQRQLARAGPRDSV